MGNVPVCNCLVNISKDKEGGNFYLNEEENKKENSKMKNNKINNNNILNSDSSKENQKENNDNNKIDKISKNNSSFNPNNNSSFNKNNIINKNKVNKENKKKNTHDSSEITNDKENNKLNKKEKEEKEIKENNELKKKEEEKKIEKINIKKEEKKEENEKEEKELEKNQKKLKKKIEKSKFAKTIIICGPMESGKTSFSIRYCENKFDNCYIPSFMNEVSNKIFLLNNGEKILKIKFIVTNNIKDLDDVDCYFVIYDLNSNQSFIQAKKLVEDNLINENIHIFFIGNKSDLKCVVNKNEVEDFCNKFKIQFFYISVKNNIGISALMVKFSQLFKYDDD